MSDVVNPPSRRARIKRYAVLSVLVLGAAGAAGWAFADRGKAGTEPAQSAAAEAPVRPVQVRKVTFTDLAPPRVLVGTLRARVETDRGFRVAGKIARRAVETGSRVKAGDLLATLDETDFRLQRESAEAELAAARSAARQALLERDRIAELRAKGWSTEQAADRQRATVDEANGRVARAERQVELARNAQSYAELRAEADGTVIAVTAEAGQVVPAGQPVFRIAQDGDREALVAIPEQDIALAREAGAEVTLWSDPGRKYKAHLRELSPSADAATRTFSARFILEGIAADAPLGMTATLDLTPKSAGKIARVPLSAVLNEGRGTEVFVLDAKTGLLARKPVSVSAYESRDALVTGGLTEGDLVVTLGIHTLREGQPVRALAEARL